MNLDVLKKYNQEHLLNFAEELSENEKTNLENQIDNIDFEYVESLFKNRNVVESKDKEITNIPATDKEKVDKEKYSKIGIDAIKNGMLAVCSMAGGQGTRLGFDGPKGTYMLNINGKQISIFETIINKLKKVQRDLGTTLYWYIMTSNQNNDATIKFFEDNHYFGYDKSHIIFFKQGELPLIDEDGKIALKSKGEIFMAPDGNGGIFKALDDNGILKHMEEHSIKYLAVGNVDNILINLVDEVLLGLMIENNTELASKSFLKPSPEGKWGVFCRVNGKPQVIEYIETPRELLEARNEDGELIYGDAHLGCNVLDLRLLKRIAKEKLPMHVAKKQNKVLDLSTGEIVLKDTFKFESFIFDAFMAANEIMVFRVKKDEEFAPIKNKEGDESPESAIRLYEKIINAS